MDNPSQRLNKYIASIGLCSRRDVKQFLKQQIVTVNGVRVKESGFRIDPQKDDIKVNGNKMKIPQFVYYLLNKPKGIISTTADEYNRKNVTSLIHTKERIYPVGRLDKDTTGLLLLTNDGELTNSLIHPRYHVNKIYRLTIKGNITKEQLHALRYGVLLDDGITYPAVVKIISEKGTTTICEMTIHEGRNRQIRRMCETVGITLLELQRISFGPLALGTMQIGTYRMLTEDEIKTLKKITVSIPSHSSQK